MPWETSDRSLLADLSLARGDWDRDAERRRCAQALGESWADPRCRVIPVAEGRFPVTGGDTPRLAPVSPADVPIDAERLYLGGDEQGRPWFAVRVPSAEPSAGLREVGAELAADEVSVAAMAVALDNWHAAHPHC